MMKRFFQLGLALVFCLLLYACAKKLLLFKSTFTNAKQYIYPHSYQLRRQPLSPTPTFTLVPTDTATPTQTRVPLLVL